MWLSSVDFGPCVIYTRCSIDGLGILLPQKPGFAFHTPPSQGWCQSNGAKESRVIFKNFTWLKLGRRQTELTEPRRETQTKIFVLKERKRHLWHRGFPRAEYPENTACFRGFIPFSGIKPHLPSNYFYKQKPTDPLTPLSRIMFFHFKQQSGIKQAAWTQWGNPSQNRKCRVHKESLKPRKGKFSYTWHQPLWWWMQQRSPPSSASTPVVLASKRVHFWQNFSSLISKGTQRNI